MIQLACAQCGGRFHRAPSRAARARFCSVACRSDAEASRATERLTYRVDASGCWIWTGPLDRHGYGRTSYRSRPTRAHRLSYELHCEPISAGLQIDHVCRVRACINPAHLEPVTALENVLRARRDHCKRGHSFSGDNLAWTANGRHRRCRACERINANECNRRKRAKPVQQSLLTGTDG